MNPHGQRELLAGDAVDERLKYRWEARRPEPTHSCRKRAEQRVAGGHIREG